MTANRNKEAAGTPPPTGDGPRKQDQAAVTDRADRPQDTVPESDQERRKRQRAALSKQLAELDAQDAADGVSTVEPDKRITLAGGDVVEISGAVPTHYDTGDGGGLRRVVDVDPITD